MADSNIMRGVQILGSGAALALAIGIAFYSIGAIAQTLSGDGLKIFVLIIVSILIIMSLWVLLRIERRQDGRSKTSESSIRSSEGNKKGYKNRFWAVAAFIRRHWRMISGGIVFILFTVFPFVLQASGYPVFQPSISEPNVKLLYVLGQMEKEEGSEVFKPVYYDIFRVTYTVRTPIIPWNREAVLKSPGDPNKSSGIFLNGMRIPKNPYVETDIFNEDELRNFVDMSMREGISIITKTGLLDSKEIHLEYEFRENRDLRGWSSIFERFNWIGEDHTIAPLEEAAIHSNNRQVLGYGILQGDKPKLYEFKLLYLENTGDVQINNYFEEIPSYGEYNWICEKGYELTLPSGFGDDKGYLVRDILPGEEQRYLMVTQLSDDQLKYHDKYFNFTERNRCIVAWDVYGEYV